MISVIGLGNAASTIVEKFKQTKNYNVYQLNSEVKRNSKYKYRLKSFENPEDYESNIPNLKNFFAEVDDIIHFFIVGSSFSSNYSLGILQQLSDKKVDVFYIQPDAEDRDWETIKK